MKINEQIAPIAIIPARGGSKRIKNKNIKQFCGKPLIAYSIEAAIKSGVFGKVIVTTDDETIAKVAREYGALVPFMRPDSLADDFSTSGEAVNHAIEFLSSNAELGRFVCTIYATAPLLSLRPELLSQAFKRLKSSGGARQVFSATSMNFPIWRSFSVDEDSRCEMFFPEYFSTRSQDLVPAYGDAGQFYFDDLAAPAGEIGFSKDKLAFILPRHMVCDIDTIEDWQMAEVLYELNKKLNS
ncbi:pseudaminic acid cytidylyltransferase [Campylobacter sp. 19-13652]|uniref:pseudaminic acid cytidylyltransferase n=1 Tax=Campylobacter sp. 19-13652 TaxID=2840180 RepID=UPI001C7707EF|nr:pseudaminic acid cytidylyltransferase [Campylobacter sp. 19-13652]BCX79209.1 pseudaminic acid cytidylyltransferase [Campylobacter sp. 19-13652]